jgi:DNA-directed RNA polymerase subunit M/transcription elongation factor TFIIS
MTHPKCPKCGQIMAVARLRGYINRVFDCRQCGSEKAARATKHEGIVGELKLAIKDAGMSSSYASITHQGNTGEHEPIELEDDHAARVEATTACREILKDVDGELLHGSAWRLDAAHANRAPMYSLRPVPEDLREGQ